MPVWKLATPLIEKSEPGVVVPIPTEPMKVVVERREVEEAKRPWVNQRGVEVEFTSTPKLVVGVNEKVPDPEPQAVPVFEMVPLVEKVAQPAAPPAEETIKLVELAVAAVTIVVLAYGNTDAVEVVAVKKPASALIPRSEEPSTESLRHGEEVPMPMLLLVDAIVSASAEIV